MRKINDMIAAFYLIRKRNRKQYDGKEGLFSIKILFCLLAWIWLLPTIGLLQRAFDTVDIIAWLPKDKLFALIYLLILYPIINHLTWNLHEIEKYIAVNENEESLKSAKRLFFILLISGFVFLVIVALYNKYYPIQD
ncbi:hypothetical protein [Emticicia sp. C21]|uniref:hypothetical protein n=1 Tax=Emticicia sp. C21 TaxID=2302915 RepID=UPI000E35600A|nr:hypothetical protein [Emticicia sp. C21]RFS13737.1 hypothetical protein D0T08_24660 [Emticicia sp. C21]